MPCFPQSHVKIRIFPHPDTYKRHFYTDTDRSAVRKFNVKDVAPELADERRGEDTGIASSDVYVGEGVNADNIIECLKVLKKNNYKGVLSLECGGEALTEKSFTWLTKQVNALK